jgi:methionine aminotransferase
MREGLNQYPSMLGVLELRQAIAQKIHTLYQKQYDPVTEITVTAGATQAIINAILAVVRAGDEVIVLEPCYDSYIPNIELAGGTVVRVPLTPGSFRPDFDRISAAITPRTRAMLINSPHNPSATVWSDADMLRLQEILAPTQVLLISDEVYEHWSTPRWCTAAPLLTRAWPNALSSFRALAKPTMSPVGKWPIAPHRPV